MSGDPAIVGLSQPWITLPPGQGRCDSALRRLTIAGKLFYILRQRGKLQEMAYDHGRLLAREMEEGAFPEIIATIARGTSFASPLKSWIARGMFRALSDMVLDNVSEEFRGAAEELADGYRDGSPGRRFSRQQVLDATAAIEVGNLTEGVLRQKDTSVVPLGSIRRVLRAAAAHVEDDETRQRAAAEEPDEGVVQAAVDAFSQMADERNRYSLACTGFSIPASATTDGRHLHARNLDADIYQWNRAPVLFLLDETPGGVARHKYVAFGTAGLIYPGGISGINDAGLAVSLHQLSTTRLRWEFGVGRADIAPFVQQRILREAGSLPEAIEIVHATRHFAAWVIFCSDAKTGVTQRFEFNGEKIRYSDAFITPVAQTNHFLHDDLVERLFTDDDAHFTPSFGKYLETRARLAMVEDALAKRAGNGRMGVDEAIDLLASGRDWNLVTLARRLQLGDDAPAAERSFGRGPRKVYGQLGSIVIGDPERRDGRDEAWMTVGDRLPACHSVLAGWRIDWAGLDVQPVADRPLRRTRAYERHGRRHWEQSLQRYLMARVTETRPRGADGMLLERAVTEAEAREDLTRAEHLLSSAIQLAGEDRIVEPPYHYMRARLRHRLGRFAEAKADWDLLRGIWAKQNGSAVPAGGALPAELSFQPLLHEYEAALVLTLSAVTEDRLQGGTGWIGRGRQLKEARALLRALKAAEFGASAAHFDLERWIERINDIKNSGIADGDLPAPSFITVE